MDTTSEDHVWRCEGFEVDSSRAPLVVVRYPAIVKPGAIQLLFDHYSELTRRRGDIAWLIDFTSFNPVTAPANRRKEAAEVFAAHREMLAASTCCEARVVHNTLARGILTAFDWLTGNKWPTASFATFVEAERWIEQTTRNARG